jgi:Nif-specific regulatory protein
LFYRLNVVPIKLPALRERRDDIPILIDHFLRSSNERNDKDVILATDALDFLMNYYWPGNVRELQNLVERLVILADDMVIRPLDLHEHMGNVPGGHRVPEHAAPLPPSLPGPFSKPVLPSSLRDMERQEIEAALRRNGWVQARAARELGLTQRQMGYRIKKFNLERPDFALAVSREFPA